MNPVYKKAIDEILKRINFVNGARRPDDFECVVDMFKRLLNAGEHVKDDEIYQYITKKDVASATGSQKEETVLEVTRDTAGRIQLIYDVLEMSKRPLDCWGDEFIQEILEESQS